MARRNTTQIKETWQIAAVVLIVLVTSLFLVFSPAPEQVLLRSENGLVTFEGVARPATGVELVVHEDVVAGEGVLLPVYEISTPNGVVIEDGEVHVRVEEASIDLTEASVVVFDVYQLDWEPLLTSFDLAEGSVSAVLDVSGSVLVGVLVQESE